jgi:PEP-CTERM motif
MMTTKFKQLLVSMSVLAVLVILPAAVKADPVTFTLDDTHSVAQGSSVTFFGTLSNGGPPTVFLNAISFSFASGAPGSITFNDAAFFALPASLTSGSSTGLAAFFDVVVSALVPPGVYTGTVSILGGADENAQNNLGTQEFSITVTPGGQQPVPEPATMLLLGSGLAGAAALRRRKRRQGQTH